MFNLHQYIKKRLAAKILVALTIGVAIAMGGIIYISISSQRQHLHERMITFGKRLNYLAYAGIKHPMSIGDSASVEKQLLDINNHLAGTEIVICDFNQEIIFATHQNRIKQQISQFITDQKALSALENIFEKSDPAYENYFEEVEGGKRYLISINSIANETECHHCHGESRKVLGSILTRHSTDATYGAIAALRNRTLIISIFGIGAIVLIIYLLIARLVTRPVTDLAEKAELLAQGDLSVSVQPLSDDAIGVLSKSFNEMVTSIKGQIEVANSLKGAIADPLFMVDRNFMVTYMNKACEQLTGYSKAEVENKMSCSDLFHSSVCDSNCPVRKCFETGGSVEGITAEIITKESHVIPIMTSASVLRDAHGSIIGAVEICKDISDLLEAERLRYIKKTAQREEELRKYLETRAEKLLVTLSQVASGNLSVRAEQGGTNEVMDKISMHTNDMLDNLEKSYQKLSSFSKELELEVARRTMMLRERTLLLERANRELRELDRLKSSFLANMSHELRTPMNSIIGYTDLMLDRVDGDINEEQEKSLEKISNNAKHLLQLINDILDMSKIESGKIDLDLKYVDITQLIQSTAAVFEAAVQKKNLFLKYSFAEGLPQVYVDEDKARQVLNNLLSNAIKFTHTGGVTISADISRQGIDAGDEPLFVEICVEDTGIGINQEDIGKLFDKFSQIDVSSIRQYEGTGLGLSIARGLVVLHKGVIWAESVFGKGTKLCFTLPANKSILEKPSKPVVEPIMADTLAAYFNKPRNTFLKEAQYGGKSVKCWEYTHCGQTSCPAYGSEEHRCWLISGTHCKGTEVAKCPEKAEFCKGCEIIEKLVLVNSHVPEKEMVNVLTQNDVVPSTRKTVMVIDDNPEVIELIRKNIGEDYQVVGFLSGMEAVERAKEIKPIAITLDIMMPHRDGWQVLQDLKKDPITQDIPVIILSIVDEKKMGFSLGAAEYIVKPLNKNILLKKLRNLEHIASIQQILVVDQELESLNLTGQMLQEEDYFVQRAIDTEKAIRSVSESRPDVIVINLTGGSDHLFDFIEHIKSTRELKNIPLILITNEDLSQEEIRQFNGCIKATINKGILSEEELLAQLKKNIEKIQKTERL